MVGSGVEAGEWEAAPGLGLGLVPGFGSGALVALVEQLVVALGAGLNGGPPTPCSLPLCRGCVCTCSRVYSSPP